MAAKYYWEATVRTTYPTKWLEWFAWHPVSIHNDMHWFKKVFRRKIAEKKYEYGTLLDVLKDDPIKNSFYKFGEYSSSYTGTTFTTDDVICVTMDTKDNTWHWTSNQK